MLLLLKNITFSPTACLLRAELLTFQQLYFILKSPRILGQHVLLEHLDTNHYWDQISHHFQPLL